MEKSFGPELKAALFLREKNSHLCSITERHGRHTCCSGRGARSWPPRRPPQPLCGPRARPRTRGSLGPTLRMSWCLPAPGRKRPAELQRQFVKVAAEGKGATLSPSPLLPEERTAERRVLPREPLPWSWSDNTGRETAQSREAGSDPRVGRWLGLLEPDRGLGVSGRRACERAAGCLQTPPAGNLALRLSHEAAQPLSTDLEGRVG